MPAHRLIIGTVLAAAIGLYAGSAAAQDAGDRVSPTGKGITGGALLGGEAVMLTEAAIGVKPVWAYLVGGVVGAAGGGVGGYFAEQQGTARLSLYLLAGGMALAIPTTIAVLDQTAYDPPVEFTQDSPPADEPVAEPPTSEPDVPGADRAPPAAPPATEPAALLGLRPHRLVLSVPMVEVREMFTRRELAEFGLKQRTEVSIAVFSAAF